MPSRSFILVRLSNDPLIGSEGVSGILFLGLDAALKNPLRSSNQVCLEALLKNPAGKVRNPTSVPRVHNPGVVYQAIKISSVSINRDKIPSGATLDSIYKEVDPSLPKS